MASFDRFTVALLLLAAACDSSGGEGSPATVMVTVTTYIGTQQSNVPFVAAQDGDGSWQPLSGASGTYSFATSGRFGLAYVCEDPAGSPILYILHASTADFTAVTRVCPSASTTSSISGAVSGLGASETALVSIGAAMTSGVTASYQLEVPLGTWDAIATRIDGTTMLGNRVSVLRDIEVGASPGTRDIDFSTSGEDTVLGNVSITNLADGEMGSFTYNLSLEDGTRAYTSLPGTSVAFAPESLLTGSDAQVVDAFGSDPVTMGLRTDTSSVTAPQDITFTLPDPLVATASRTPLTVSFSSRAAATAYEITFANMTAWIDVLVTPNWISGASQVTYTSPDFSGIEGWSAAWDPDASSQLFWSAGVYESSFSFDEDPAPGRYLGARRYSCAQGSLAP